MENESINLEKMKKEWHEMDERLKAREAQGLSDIYKYFDRINDKISSFNNMLIAGYFALIALSSSISKSILFIPLLNMILLVYLDYKMMEQGRIMSQITSQPTSQINKYGKWQNRITLISLFTIVTTGIVTIVFLFILNTATLQNILK